MYGKVYMMETQFEKPYLCVNSAQLDSIEFVEVADDNSQNVSILKPKRAIITLPIINIGANEKNLEWTRETMERVAHKFRGVPFRFDLTGQNEGSHTKDRISSPF